MPENNSMSISHPSLLLDFVKTLENSLPSYFFRSVFRPLVSAGARAVFRDPRGSFGSVRRSVSVHAKLRPR